MSIPKFNISSFGYFGYFLAKEMYELNRLNMLYTNLTTTRSNAIPKSMKKIHLSSRLVYLFSRLGIQTPDLANFTAIRLFDDWLAKNLSYSEIFHSFSSFCLSSMKKAKKMGSMTIIERGSSHIEYQNSILREEYKKWKVDYHAIPDSIIDRELEEYNECDFITVQSSFAKNTFLDKGFNSNKLIKIPLGVDLKLFKPLQKSDDKFRVLYSGNFSIRKGAMYILQAINEINLPNFEFVINGHIAKEMEELIKPYASKIKFLGSRKFNELYRVYSQASVLVLPTIEDGFAKVITEAMACRTPVIATTNCGSLDVIDDGINGFIVPIRNSQIIKEKLLTLYEDNYLLEEMSNLAYQKAKVSLKVQDHGANALKEYESRYNNFIN